MNSYESSNSLHSGLGLKTLANIWSTAVLGTQQACGIAVRRTRLKYIASVHTPPQTGL